MYDSKQIADFFISETLRIGKKMTVLKLHNLMYQAQGYHLAMTGEPLFDDDIEARTCGAVLSKLNKIYRVCEVEECQKTPNQ